MDIENLKQTSLDFVREQYLKYLNTLDVGQNTVSTTYSDSFYLWRKKGKDCFWSVATSDNFEEDARIALTSALSDNSSGKISSLVNPYVSALRRFWNFINSDIKVDFTDEASESLRSFKVSLDDKSITILMDDGTLLPLIRLKQYGFCTSHEVYFFSSSSSSAHSSSE